VGAAVEYGLHQTTTDALPLRLGRNGDGTDSGDRPALIEEIGSHDLSVSLGDDAPDVRVRNEIARELRCGFQSGEIPGKLVVAEEAAERLVDDPGTVVAA
jgi:hypothetical protein